MISANLVEIFSSVQGEGPHVGVSTLFVRLGECDLRCRWCDSPHTWRRANECRVVPRRSGDAEQILPNPVPLDTALAAAEALGLATHRFASLTGGEPLLQPEAAAALAAGLRAAGPRVLLETHGLHADALSHVLPHIDVVSMDWKLTSEVRRASDPSQGAIESFHAAHEDFLRVAREAPECTVKLVLTPSTTDTEVDEACARIRATGPDAIVVLQPVTPRGGVRERPSAERVLALADRAAAHGLDVRVIPQTHPVYDAP